MPAYRPEDLHKIFCEAFNAKDAEAVTALYECEAILVTDGVPVQGREAIAGAFSRLFAERGAMRLETRSVVESPADGVAVLHGSWEISGEAGSRGISTEVVRRQADGTWLFWIDEPETPR